MTEPLSLTSVMKEGNELGGVEIERMTPHIKECGLAGGGQNEGDGC